MGRGTGARMPASIWQVPRATPVFSKYPCYQVMCSGVVHPNLMVEALTKGAGYVDAWLSYRQLPLSGRADYRRLCDGIKHWVCLYS